MKLYLISPPNRLGNKFIAIFKFRKLISERNRFKVIVRIDGLRVWAEFRAIMPNSIDSTNVKRKLV